MGKTSVAVMVLYHDKDEKEKGIIVKHLSVIKRQDGIDLWEKGLVLAGENPEQMIQNELDKAEIVLFLVSIESIDSDKLWKDGVEHSLKRHQQGGLIFIPVIVRDCQWEQTVLNEFKPLPEDGKPISHWPRPDEPCKQVADAVKQHVEKIKDQKRNENKQQGIIPPEFQEIDSIFQKMAKTSTKILEQCASELENTAKYLMKNRDVLDIADLMAEKAKLSDLRTTISSHLSGKQQPKFDANMDQVEDILDGLIRQIKFENQSGTNFTSGVRELSGFLRAAASLIWSLTTLFFSIHSNS